MPRVIVIDDDRDLSQLTRAIIADIGYDVAVFHDAESAIANVKIHKPDLVIMDIMLPGMNGAEAIKEMRKEPNLHNLPVIFLSGLVSSEERDLQIAGINVSGTNFHILPKPYDRKELLDLAKSLLK